jgi:hypothetical protein
MPEFARVKKIIVDIVKEDGTVEEREFDVEADGGEYRHAQGIDHDQNFWFATNHPAMLQGRHVIASSMTEQSPEGARDWTNTLIGLIRDKNCAVVAVYDPDYTGLVK